jgi:hypothetical protein
MADENFVPDGYVALAREQHPDKPWLADGLAGCTRVVRETKYYVYFVHSTNANQPGAEWQFRESVFLDLPTGGTILIDVLKDGRISGFEWYSRLLGG